MTQTKETAHHGIGLSQCLRALFRPEC